MGWGENPTVLLVPACPPLLTPTCSLSSSPPEFPVLNINVLQLFAFSFFFFFRYNLATMQPELFLAKLVTEQPSTKGSAVQRTTRERVSPLFQTALACHAAHTKRSQPPPNPTLQKPEETDKFSFSIYKDAERFWLLWQLREPFHAIVVTAINL